MSTSATNTQTTLAYHMIPARTLHIDVAGSGFFGGGGKIQFNLYNGDGTNLLIQTGNFAPLSNTEFCYSGIIYVTCYTADVAGTCRVSGIIHMVDAGSSANMGGWGFYCVSSLPLDTTVTHKWRVTANFDTNGNTIDSNTVNIINVA